MHFDAAGGDGEPAPVALHELGTSPLVRPPTRPPQVDCCRRRASGPAGDILSRADRVFSN